MKKKKVAFYNERILSDGKSALDIDIDAKNCDFANWTAAFFVKGRGCVIDNCGFTNVLYAQLISAPEDINYGVTGADLSEHPFKAKQTTMRHYNIRNCRFDGSSFLVGIIEGVSADAKIATQNINNIQLIGNDCNNIDGFIVGLNADLTSFNTFNSICIKNSAITNNTILGKINDYWINWIDSLKNTEIIGNTFASHGNFNYLTPTPCDGIAKISGVYENVTVDNNTCRQMGDYLLLSTGTSEHKNVHIGNNNFTEWNVRPATTNNPVLFKANSICLGLIINNNAFHTSDVSGSFRYADAIQPGYMTVKSGNVSNFKFDDTASVFEHKVNIGSNKYTGNLNSPMFNVKSSYVYDGNSIKGHGLAYIKLSQEFISANSSLAISLTMPTKKAIPFAPSMSGSLCGSAVVDLFSHAGVTDKNQVEVLLNTGNELKLEIKKIVGDTSNLLKVSDLTADQLYTIGFSYEYLYSGYQSEL